MTTMMSSPAVKTGCLFLLCCTAFVLWGLTTHFTDPDAFYHMKITQLTMDNLGPIQDFHWLPYTTLNDHYVDHHFLYHLFLIPFFLTLGPVLGIKLAAVFLASGFICLFYTVLRQYQVRWPFIFACLLLFTNGFAFRLALSKAPAFSLLFLFGLFGLILKNQWKWLIPVSLLYVWVYGGFSLALILGAMYAGSVLIHTVLSKRAFTTPVLWQAIRPGVAITVGIGLGLIVNPAFPSNVFFYWEQLIQIGIVNYQDVIAVGGEWYPASLAELCLVHPQLTLLVLIGLIAYFRTARTQDTASTTALLFTILLFAMSLKSRRFFEYYAPWAYLFSAFVLHRAGWLPPHPTRPRNRFNGPEQSPIGSCYGAQSLGTV